MSKQIARELRDMASECRELATLARRQTVRDALLEMADSFDQLAEHYLKEPKVSSKSKFRVPPSGT